MSVYLGNVKVNPKAGIPVGGESLLPEGYSELPYLESSGEQYIDTGVTGQNGVIVKTKIKPISVSGNQCLIGSINNNGERYNVGIGDGFFEMQYWTQYGASSEPAVADNEYELEIRWVYNDGSLKVNGNIAQTRTGSESSATRTMYLFARHNGSSADRFSITGIGRTMIFVNGMLARLFIPCSNPYGEKGMYDFVTDAFYGNQGSGRFA